MKLDENLGVRGTRLLVARGIDVATVLGQDLCAATDATLAEICRIEDRVLVTFDVDFANPIRFRPSRHAGLVVLRLSEPVSASDIEDALSRVLDLHRLPSEPVHHPVPGRGDRVMKLVERADVLAAARSLLEAHGETTTLEVKTALREQGFFAVQADVSRWMRELANELDWPWLQADGFRVYVLVVPGPRPDAGSSPGQPFARCDDDPDD